jgi:hypothetical protein
MGRQSSAGTAFTAVTGALFFYQKDKGGNHYRKRVEEYESYL